MDMASLNKITYSQKLFLWLLGYSMLLVGCFIGFQYSREKEFKAAELNSQLQLINAHILDELANSKDPASVTGHCPHYFEELRVSIIDSTGNVIYDNSLDSLPGVNHQSRSEIAEAISTGQGYTVRRHSESTGNNYFYSATRGNDGYVVRTAVPYSVSLHSLLHADFRFLWIMGGVTLVMCLVGYMATRRLGKTIMRLNRFAERADRGERIYDTTPFPNDELGSISNHIVRLYANLQQAIADRDREHRAALHEQQEKQRIKKQLTNNINHELKTPVASIQVCIETLLSHKDLSEEKQMEFLRRCESSVMRLKSLLDDVALITRMEDAPTTLSRERIDLSETIAETVSECTPAAIAQNIDIIDNISHPIYIDGNQPLLASVFRNLIDNAIAYSGGNRIEIEAIRCENGKITLTVADNGCGVPKEHLPRLFERFYRIDKGRSRQAGGTGLGLAIVKNAVQLHGGNISVKNRREGGLIFTITLNTSQL